jgi:hypothetical protein
LKGFDFRDLTLLYRFLNDAPIRKQPPVFGLFMPFSPDSAITKTFPPCTRLRHYVKLFLMFKQHLVIKSGWEIDRSFSQREKIIQPGVDPIPRGLP